MIFKLERIFGPQGSKESKDGRDEVIAKVMKDQEELAHRSLHQGTIEAALQYLLKKEKIDGYMFDLARSELLGTVATSPEGTKPNLTTELIDELVGAYVMGRGGDQETRLAHENDIREALGSALADLPRRVEREREFEVQAEERGRALGESYAEIVEIVNNANLSAELKALIKRSLDGHRESENTEIPEETAPQDPVARFKCLAAYSIRHLVPQFAQMSLGSVISEDEWKRYAQEFYPKVLEWAGDSAMERGFSIDPQE